MQHKWLQAAKVLTSALLLLSCAFYPAQGKPAEKLILKEQIRAEAREVSADGSENHAKLKLVLPQAALAEPEPKPQPKKLTLKKAKTPGEEPLPYTDQEIEMIAAVVMHEVGHCSKESKLAVTRVIANRLADGRFGKTVYEVLHAKGQFGAIHNYYDHEIVPDEACYAAVREALREGGDRSGALYFCNPRMIGAGNARWFSSLQFLFSLDGQYYYR